MSRKQPATQRTQQQVEQELATMRDTLIALQADYHAAQERVAANWQSPAQQDVQAVLSHSLRIQGCEQAIESLQTELEAFHLAQAAEDYARTRATLAQIAQDLPEARQAALLAQAKVSSLEAQQMSMSALANQQRRKLEAAGMTTDEIRALVYQSV